MRTKMMSSVARRTFPTMMLATATFVGLSAGVCLAQDTESSKVQTGSPAGAESAAPSGLPGPFYARPMPPGSDGMTMGGFPPMGFDPMTGTVAPNVVPSDDHERAMSNRTAGGAGANAAGDTQADAEVNAQVRARMGIGGRANTNANAQGLGNPGWGGFYGPGAPFPNGYGAPYGTPFNASAAGPQYAPQDPLQSPSAEGAATAQTEQPAYPSAATPQTASPYSARPTFPQPFSWAPSAMPLPGFSAGPGAGASAQSQEAAPAPQAEAVQPQQPDWVAERRAEADQRRLEAEKRLKDMRSNNYYAGRGYPQPYGQGFGSGYGQPYGQGYGAPYGVPYGQPYGYAPQVQPQAAPKSEEKTN